MKRRFIKKWRYGKRMTKDVFTFRQFSVRQDRCAMKVGTDGVLLGAWADGGARILDIGAGTGLISLMMAQRFPGGLIDGVEADVDAAGQAADNAKPFPQVAIHAVRLQDWEPPEPYDCIVSNPPFFIDSLKNPSRQRSLARHDVDLSFADIMSFAKRWLTETGQLSVILPADVVGQFSEIAYFSGFRMCRQSLVQTTESKPFKRQLLAFSKSTTCPLVRTEHCLLQADGSRSDWYADITKDFYIY